MNQPPGVVTPSTNPATLLDVTGVNLSLRGKPILQDIALRLEQGHILTVIGLNGSGKTTLLKVILGLVKPDQGRIWLRPGSRIGYMPQRLSIDETLPMTVQRFMQLGVHQARGKAGLQRVRAALAETGAENVLGTPLQALSGGELQRVLLARALLREPDLLVLDEPVQAVDVAGQYELYDLISTIRDRHHCGILLVSHDLHLVLPASDQVICMNHHICCAGTPEHVTQHPAFRQLFGQERSRHMAIYRHHHDHQHDHHGTVVNIKP
ncbi:MAG: metal ABC transporter ATP-binding protein [Gammaproteobacteria bacterium]